MLPVYAVLFQDSDNRLWNYKAPDSHRELVGGPIQLLAFNGQRHTGCEALEANDGDLIRGIDLVIVLSEGRARGINGGWIHTTLSIRYIK